MTTFFVPGIPAPQGSKSFKGFRGGKPVLAESSKALPKWRRTVRETAAVNVTRDAALFPTQAAAIHLEFAMPRPKYAIGKLLPAVKRPDTDKLTRAVLDSLSGVIYKDDNQVTDLRVTKRLASSDEPTGVHVTYRQDTTHESRSA